MEIYLPSSARQHWVYGRRETSSQRMETEAPITMVMAIGDRANSHKKQCAGIEARRYRTHITTLTLEQLLQIDVAVLDFMSFVDYGDGLSLPAEVGVARGCLGDLELERCRVYGGIPHIPYRDQRTGFASDAKETCERVHGIDVLDYRTSKVKLDVLCHEMKSELEGSPLLLCRSEDLNRVLGSWYWLQDNPAVETLSNIGVMMIEDFLVHTLTRLHQLSGVLDGGVPTFSQFTTLLTRSANDLNTQFRCDYHNTVEMAWDKAGCARKNAMKYLGTISDCVSPGIADCRSKSRAVPTILPPPGPVPTATARAEFQAQIIHASHQPGPVTHYDHSNGGYNPRPHSREGSVHSSGSSSSSFSSAHIQLSGESSPSQSSLDSSARPRRRGRSSPPGSTGSSSGAARITDNPLGLLTPDYFQVSKNQSNFSEDSASTRSGSPPSARQRVRSPHSVTLPPSVEEISTFSAEQDTFIPAPPRRPESSFSTRKSCSTSSTKKEEQSYSLPSSGVTNLPLLAGPVSAGPSHNLIGSTSTPEAEEISCVTGLPRRPVSFNNWGKEAEKETDLTYNTNNKAVTPAQHAEGTVSYSSQRNGRNGRRSGTSTVPSDTVLVPTALANSAISTAVPTALANSAISIAVPTALANSAISTAVPTALATFAVVPTAPDTGSDAISAAFALASAAQSATNLTPTVSAAPAAPPHPAFLQAFSAAEPTSQITPPPGFDPVPKYRTIPSGFAIAPLPNRNVRLRANLNESASSEDAENSPDLDCRGSKPAKKRGRN